MWLVLKSCFDAKINADGEVQDTERAFAVRRVIAKNAGAR